MMILDLKAIMENETTGAGSAPAFFSTRYRRHAASTSTFGFRDAFHFSRTFKKIFGASPDTFRRPR